MFTLCLASLPSYGQRSKGSNAFAAFEFAADGATGAELGQAISSHYGINVLVYGDLQTKTISGTVRETSLEKVLDAFAFLLGTRWREVNGSFYVGGSEETKVSVFSRGMVGDAVDMFGPNVSASGDFVIVRDTETAVGEVEAALKAVNDVRALKVRLHVWDCSSEDYRRLNEWLEGVSFAVDLAADTAAAGLAVTGSATKGPWRWLNRRAAVGTHLETSATVTGTVSSVVALLPSLRETNVSLDTEITLVGGVPVVVSLGELLEREISDRVATDGGAAPTFRTGFERRTVGLELDLQARTLGERWIVETKMQDSNRSGQRETVVNFQGSAIVDPSQAWRGVHLISYTRSGTSRDVAALRGLPRLKRDRTHAHTRRVVAFISPAD